MTLFGDPGRKSKGVGISGSDRDRFPTNMQCF